ncbi:hypothetical protein ScPMuIL_018985 [Solemya velum]
MASEDAVRATNDDASQCKRFAVEKGYWEDPYISLLTSRPQAKHAPEINRGYYARVHGLRVLLEHFLKLTECRCQIVNLGAGFDTTFWVLKDRGLAPKSFIEVDFPILTAQKCRLIKSRKALLEKIVNEAGEISVSSSELHGNNYHLVGANLQNLSDFEKKLEESGFDKTLPTVFVAECVLIYMEMKRTEELVKWISDNITTSFFLNYEQVHMADKFGQVMVDNLKARDCTLPGIKACVSLETQRERFLSRGWDGCDSLEMTHVYNFLPQKEIQRIEKLEFLDERELLDQLFAHYCITWAWKDPTNIGLAEITF